MVMTAAVTFAAIAALTMSGAQAAATGTAEGAAVPALHHVFVIVGENTSYSELNRDRTPYLIGTLRPQSAWLTGYRALAHNSLANYVGLTSGQFTRCEQDDGLPADCHQDVGNVFQQLDGAGLTWTVWMESMPEPCGLDPGGSTGTLNYYHPVHNPAIYFDGVEGGGGVWSATAPSAECLADDVPMGSTGPDDTSAFDAALASGGVANLNLVVPNICEDGHSLCPTGKSGHGRYRQFDDFLRREIPLIEASPAFDFDSVIVVVYDEASSSTKQQDGGHVAAALLGPGIAPGSYDGAANHYSLLRMIEQGFGLPLLAGAATARPLPDVWAP
jgi:hypothetical protein